jgi:outer membrane protein OmpA-like peptidoglycan-associated protein
MKKKIYIPGLLLLTLFAPIDATSQEDNLIPNPGFEQYKRLPEKGSEGLSCVDVWRNPILIGLGDYYHADSKSRKYKTGRNVFGWQQPHSGKAFAGICVNKKIREYLQVQLLRPLKKDKEYRISIFISCADKIWLSKLDEFGIIFTKKEITIFPNEYLPDPPTIIFRDENMYKNKKDWIELSAIYKATGIEKVMTFGSFLYREKVVVETKEHGKVSGFTNYAHYYVDDISIIPLDDELPVQASISGIDPQVKKATPAFVTGNSYIFRSIQFETGKSELLPKAYPELNELIFYLKKNPSVKIVIAGHTDNEGDTTENMKLSYERAKAVMSYLLSNEIDEKHISIVGKGDRFPIDSNSTTEGREKNRRVEISFF